MQVVGAALIYLITKCSPMVHWETMAAMVQVESRGHVFAIHDNTSGAAHFPKNVDDAVALSESLIARQHSVDIGIVQINSRNLGLVKMSVRELFDPCKNLYASQTILLDNYQRALGAGLPYGQPALQAALAAYNTGSMIKGRDYVRRVLEAAGAQWPLQPFLKM